MMKNRKHIRCMRGLWAWMTVGSIVLSDIFAWNNVLTATAAEYPTFGQLMSGETAQETPVAEDQYTVISISTEEDLFMLAQNCRLDSWSRDKYILLENDIALKEYQNIMIPSFGGIFDGGEHVISGPELTGEGSVTGLFRYVQAGGTIRNLSVSGTVAPGGSGNRAGILAGVNYGRITDCRVSGSVTGAEEIGGLVGANEAGGVIRRCHSEAFVTGDHYTGGICGTNKGTLNGCENSGDINTRGTSVSRSLEDLTVENLEDPISAGNVAVHTDTGGITGYSEGKIYYCTNRGTVGYSHVGYNTGGIVGRLHQGYLQNCTNEGHVLGRKDVGGIAGQMEPFLEIEYLNDKLSEIDRETEVFFDLLEAAHEELSGSAGEAAGLSRSITAHLTNASEAGKNLTGSANELWYVYNQELTGISNDLNRLTGEWADQAEEDRNRQEGNTPEDGNGGSSSPDGSGDNGSSSSGGSGDNGSGDGGNSPSDGSADNGSGLSDGSGDNGSGSSGGSGDNGSGSSDESGDGGETARADDGIHKVSEERAGTAGVEAQSPPEGEGTGQGGTSGSGREQQPDGGSGGQQSPSGGEGSADNGSGTTGVEAQSPSESGETGRDDSSGGENGDWKDKLPSGSTDWENRFPSASQIDFESYLAALRRFGESTAAHLGNITSATNDRSGGISGNLEILNNELNAAGNELQRLADVLQQGTDTTSANVDALMEQAKVLRRSINELRDELFRYEGIALEDVSDEASDGTLGNPGAGTDGTPESGERPSDAGDIPGGSSEGNESAEEAYYDTSSFQQGKITLCVNRGEVEADTNVGGIVGLIATEFDFDPEDDITLTGTESFNIEQTVKAVVRESRNHGAITGKKDYVGGIVGKADFGAVISCESYGAVRSTDGSCVGGIAGASDYCIRSCCVMGSISGKSRVGGIVGRGCDVFYARAYPELEYSGEYAGSIAGQLRENGTLYGNYYVQGGIPGVDSIGYEGGAMPLTYAELCSMEGVPSAFSEFTVSFRADGRELASVQCAYGEGIDASLIPEVPKKEGFHGSWPDFDYDCVTGSRVLEARYERWITSLASEEKDESGRALALIQGEFLPEAVLKTEEGDDGGMKLSVLLTDADGGETQEELSQASVRALCEDAEGAVTEILTDQGWTQVPCSVMGSYLEFSMDVPGAFRIIPEERGGKGIIAICAGICVAAAAAFLLSRVLKHGKKRKKK